MLMIGIAVVGVAMLVLWPGGSDDPDAHRSRCRDSARYTGGLPRTPSRRRQRHNGAGPRPHVRQREGLAAGRRASGRRKPQRHVLCQAGDRGTGTRSRDTAPPRRRAVPSIFSAGPRTTPTTPPTRSRFVWTTTAPAARATGRPILEASSTRASNASDCASRPMGALRRCPSVSASPAGKHPPTPARPPGRTRM